MSERPGFWSTLRGNTIYTLAPSLRRSGALSVNISGARNWLIFMCLFIYLLILYVCLLYLFSIHTWTLTSSSQWVCLDLSWFHFWSLPFLNYFYLFFTSMSGCSGHLVKLTDMQLYIFFSLFQTCWQPLSCLLSCLIPFLVSLCLINIIKYKKKLHPLIHELTCDCRVDLFSYFINSLLCL